MTNKELETAFVMLFGKPYSEFKRSDSMKFMINAANQINNLTNVLNLFNLNLHKVAEKAGVDITSMDDLLNEEIARMEERNKRMS